VGTHETLLAYLVRRLLENGANTSFVNRIADPGLALEALVEDPVRTVMTIAEREGCLGAPHPSIPLPRALFGPARTNSRGLDLADERTLDALDRAFRADAARAWRAAPMIAGTPVGAGAEQPVLNPADPGDVVGRVREATVDELRSAIAAAVQAAPAWAALPPAERASILEAAADRLEADTLALVPLLVREAGKTCANAVAEVREAVDFLRYDAMQIRRDFDPAGHTPLGPVVCISPWNFPLAIFTGQVAAALAAGNVVLAKPAEQTPLVAAAAVALLHAAGVPAGALQLLPGRGETVGAALVADARVHGVLFTGSTEVARLLQRALAGRLNADGRPVPLVAETGGCNAMVVDSSALAEQAVADIVASAFDSAGQRCSALRVLCVQDDVADRIAEMLQGAVRELRIGDPRLLATDVGPVIDADALAGIERHVAATRQRGRRIWRADVPQGLAGHFVPPTLIEIERIADLEREVFGPVLHLLRWRREELPQVLDAIAATGYGLTQGLHTRIDETVAQVVAASRAGNVYVNRNVVGAVVGVQPFGGEGLSGTGPKAGGPLYLLRLLRSRPPLAARLAVGRSGAPAAAPVRGLAAAAPPSANESLSALREWARTQGLAELAARCDQAAVESPVSGWLALPGPTGEANLYAVQPREHVLCLADDDLDRLAQLAAVLAVGAQAVWPAAAQPLVERLPLDVRAPITLANDWTQPSVPVDAVLHHGDSASRLEVAAALAQRPGPIVGLSALEPGDASVPVERLVVERSLSINTAAAGGNASLMTIG
jgi:RHH-type proline utilization regulon transcriptional repressor/proline dehydrogenase/delta 1-pyrroline-5-carboxylate dehydrogenase